MFELLCDVVQDVNAIKDVDKRSAALTELALAVRECNTNHDLLISKFGSITGFSYGNVSEADV